MSTARGGIGRSGQKHQNTFTFKHNANSKKTEKIATISHSGLCQRCAKKIEWRKKYRKYKPLGGKPAKCRTCNQMAISKAYHVLCDGCARNMKKCAWCTEELGESYRDPEANLGRMVWAKSSEVSAYLGSLRERERRKILRLIDLHVVKFFVQDDGAIVVKRLDEEPDPADIEDTEEVNDEVDDDGALLEDDTGSQECTACVNCASETDDADEPQSSQRKVRFE